MTALIEQISTLTGKNQTTVPKAVRQALGLQPGDQIAYRVDRSGAVSLSRLGDDAAAVDAFLEFLSSDIKRDPQMVKPVDEASVTRAQALTANIEVDLDGDFSDARPI